MNEILNIIHKTIYQFFDACENDEEVPMSDKDKLLLEINKAICNNLKALEQEPCDDTGEISDGYHTFNQLYHQRAILFATIVNQNKDKAWKSYKHSDGKYCFDSNGEWFIVGIDTPEGSYTYHYSKEYWDYFECKELDCGKEWDGHTEEDVTRLLSLDHEPCSDCISRKAALEVLDDYAEDIESGNWGTAYSKARTSMCNLPSVSSSTVKLQKCSDCISRKEATDRFDLVQSDDKCMSYDDIMKFLLSLPSVEPERKTGKWINVDGSTNSADCSCCGNRGRAWMNYCYLCGAKMEVNE